MQDKSRPAPQSIDAIAGEAEALQQRLKSGDRITSRELRLLWSQRLRPFWRLHIDIYRTLSRRFLDLGDNYLSSEVADEGGQFFGDDVALILTRALATARSGAPQGAQILLNQKQKVLTDAEEAKSLLARTFKDLWKSSGEKRYLKESFDLYHLDYTTTKGDRAFPGVNAASMALFLGRTDEARQIASDVLGILRTRPDTSGYWDQVTIAECLLVAGEIEPSRTAYANAGRAGQGTYAHLATTRAQARLLLHQLGHEESEFDACFPLPSVIAFTGHRIDPPDREAPRFPEAQAPAIKERIRQIITESKAGFGYSSAANGSDILFLECMQEAGLETYVHLPLPEEDFIRESVSNSASPDWVERFRTVIARATEFTCGTQTGSGPVAFDYGNRLLLGAASQHARQLGSSLLLLAVWDGVPAEIDKAGGTADYVQLARDCGCKIEVIELPGSSAASAANQTPSMQDAADHLLSILTIPLHPTEEAEARLAAIVRKRETIHCDVSDDRIRLFFRTPADAAQAGRAIHKDLREALNGALGLHSGPVRISTHPLTGEKVIRGEHVVKSDMLSSLSPGNLVYASSAFAALLGLQADPDIRSEFLGYRALNEGGSREPVFQIPT